MQSFPFIWKKVKFEICCALSKMNLNRKLVYRTLKCFKDTGTKWSTTHNNAINGWPRCDNTKLFYRRNSEWKRKELNIAIMTATREDVNDTKIEEANESKRDRRAQRKININIMCCSCCRRRCCHSLLPHARALADTQYFLCILLFHVFFLL